MPPFSTGQFGVVLRTPKLDEITRIAQHRLRHNRFRFQMNAEETKTAIQEPLHNGLRIPEFRLVSWELRSWAAVIERRKVQLEPSQSPRRHHRRFSILKQFLRVLTTQFHHVPVFLRVLKREIGGIHCSVGCSTRQLCL